MIYLVTALLILLPATFYLVVRVSWVYLLFIPVIFIASIVIQKKSNFKILSSLYYKAVVAASFVISILACLAIVLAAFLQGNQGVGAGLEQMSAIVFLVIILAAGIGTIFFIRKELTPTRQLVSQTSVTINATLVVLVFAQAASSERFITEYPWLAFFSENYLALIFIPTVLFALYNLLTARKYQYQVV